MGFDSLLTVNNNLTVTVKEKTESTNIDAKIFGEADSHDRLIISSHQTAGKGRKGRTFFSPKSTGIYMSILLHPQINAKDIGFLTTAAAVYTARVIEKYSGKKTEIKWVNDIFINSKKVCGILCESAFKGTNTPDYVIIGIGINLYAPKDSFPKEIENIAASVFNETKPNEEIMANIISDITNTLYDIIYTGRLKEHINEYKQKNFLQNKTVSFVKQNKKIKGTVTGLDDRLNLLVKTEDEKKLTLFDGEVILEY